VLFERIKLKRKEANLLQANLAEKTGVSTKTIGRWETGERVPDADQIKKLASVLGTTASYLLGETEDAAPAPMDAAAPISGEAPPLFGSPLKDASVRLLAELDEDAARKVWEYISDQKRIAELSREKGA
jgi:transcriptional regulator with XRE-family HTH domain